jgi:ATP-binding cassette subfamily B protein
MKKNLIVRQEYNKECGSACLLSIIRYYGGNVSMESLVELTKTDKFGTNFYNLSEASYTVGLASKCYKVVNITNLFEIDRPFITQIIINNFTHFVVVYKVTKEKITIMDPGRGKVIINTNNFLDTWPGYIMLFEPLGKLPLIKDNNYLKEVIVKTLFNNKKIILNIFLLSIIFTLVTCISSFYLNIIIDKTIGKEVNNLILVSVIFGLIEVVRCLTDYSRYELLLYLNQKLDLSMIINTFNKILLLPYNYYKNKTTGEILSRINDLICVRNLLSKIIIVVFLDLIVTLTSGIILFNISKKMFLILIIIIISYLIILMFFRPLIIKLTNLNQDNNAKLNSFLIENITGYETIKGLNIESIIKNKFSKFYCHFLEDGLTYDKVCNLENFLKNLINGIGVVLVIFIGINEVNSSNISLGLFLTFYFLMGYFSNPIKNILDLNRDYYYAKNSLKRMNNLLDVDSIKLLTNHLTLIGNISIKNLSFSYNKHNIILEDISIKISCGEKILILGSSGSGKSTLLKILYKYYSVPRDKVSINDYDINDLLLGDIRSNISYISQNEILYTDTIKNNILLDRDIEYNDFIKCCKMTFVDDVIKDRFLGYDTMLEENGTNISGGERQRIILARTLLRNSKIILIDEGFSEIDVNTERKILKNIFKYYKDKTILIVSHRTDNIDLYDKVISLNKGKVTEVVEKEVNYG